MDNYQHDERPFVYDGDALLRYRKIAERWTAGQATRLGMTPAVILETVRRGWLPEQIEVVTSKYALEGHPPPLEDVFEWVDILGAKQCTAKARAKDTALALAYHEAKGMAA